ncbi:MAG: P-II family nitrogen regulator [Ruminococcaceae bacterium]|nr:P-II family nitrogen regulator [Oscillospiraceae bacterium]
MSQRYECILCIVNAGFTDNVMDAAKSAGARGGTVLHARGTGAREAETFFGITVQEEKEIVMILVPADIKADVLHTLYHAVGLNTPGQGIAFSLPVDEVVGIDTSAAAEN